MSTIVVAIVVVLFSISIVRAQRVTGRYIGNRGAQPDGRVSYTCSGGRACVEGASTDTKTWGVFGTSSGSNGVEGITSGSGKAGVAGIANRSAFYGVYGASSDITGKGAALGAQAEQSATNIFFGYNAATKASCLIDPSSNLTCQGSIQAYPSAKVPAVLGQSDYDNGVKGVSLGADGVYGTTSAETAAGVYGVNVGQCSGPCNPAGVYGQSTNGSGIEGTTAAASGAGVYGTNSSQCSPESCNAVGVYGQSARGSGVEGTTNDIFAEGVLGVGTGDGTGIVAQGVHFGLFVSTSSEVGGYIFEAEDLSNDDVCEIDQSANLTCSGTIMGGQNLQTRHRTESGRRVVAFASESTSATIEDFGTARLIGGTANVQIEPTFASTINRRETYYVFLTPLGDTRGLYVSVKTPNSFQVRETQGGRSGIAFDYRIVAHPLDARTTRLPAAPAFKPPHRPHLDIPHAIKNIPTVQR